MLIGAIGVILVISGLYVFTQTAPQWEQVRVIIAQIAAVLPPSTWRQFQYVASVGAMVMGAILILGRLFGLRKIWP